MLNKYKSIILFDGGQVAQSDDGKTALHRAASSGYIDLLKSTVKTFHDSNSVVDISFRDIVLILDKQEDGTDIRY